MSATDDATLFASRRPSVSRRGRAALVSMGTRAHHGAHTPQAMLRARRPWTPWTRPMTQARTPAAGQRQPSHRTHTAKPKPHTHDQVYATSRERDCLPAARARFAGTAHCQLLTPAPTLSSPVVAAPLGAPPPRAATHTPPSHAHPTCATSVPHTNTRHTATHTHTRVTPSHLPPPHTSQESEREREKREKRGTPSAAVLAAGRHPCCLLSPPPLSCLLSPPLSCEGGVCRLRGGPHRTWPRGLCRWVVPQRGSRRRHRRRPSGQGAQGPGRGAPERPRSRGGSHRQARGSHRREGRPAGAQAGAQR